MGTIIDISIAVFLFLAILRGFWKGLVKKCLSIVLMVTICVISYIILKSTALDYLRYSLIYDVTNGQGIVVTLPDDMVIRVLSLEDLFVVLQNFDSSLSGVFLKMTCETFCKYALFIVACLISYLTTWLVTMILYYPLFRFLVRKRPSGFRVPGMLSRFLGAIIGLIQGIIVVYAMLLVFTPVSAIYEIIPDIYEKLVSLNESFDTESMKSLFDVIHNVLNLESSVILTALINISSAFGFPPVNMFKFEIDGCEYTLYDSLKILSNTFLDVLDKVTSNTSSSLNSVNLQGLYLENVKLCSDYYLNLKKGFNFNLI